MHPPEERERLTQILDPWLESYFEARFPTAHAFDLDPHDLVERLERATRCAGLIDRVWHSETSSEAITTSLSRNSVPDGVPPGVPPFVADRDHQDGGGHERKFGRFLIRRQLGHGGGGIVYLAYDPRLGRDVALKIPHTNVLINRALRERFVREARAAGGLSHPNLVPIYEAGDEGAVCYTASGYCAGPNLAQWLRQQTQPVSPRMAANLVAVLADGIQHAHNRGILHRDLKPSNVLLDSLPAAPIPEAVPMSEAAAMPGTAADASGRDELPFVPKINDFGLALFMEEDLEKTCSGALVGTANYMAPEQAAGRRAEFGPVTDVYGLGAILYELLTGQPVFTDVDLLSTLRRVQESEPTPIQKLRPGVPRDLEAICLRCLRKDPRQRYRTAYELREDLQRFLAGEATVARPISTGEKLRRLIRRHPTVAALTLGLACLLAVIPVATLVHIRQQHQMNEQLTTALEAAESLQRRASSSESQLRHLLYVSDMQLAQQAWRDGDLRLYSSLLTRYIPSDEPRDKPQVGAEDLRGLEWHLLARQGLTPQRRIAVSRHALYCVCLDAQRGQLLVAGMQGMLYGLDVRRGTLEWSIPTEQVEVNSVCLSPDGGLIATSGDNGTVRLWDTQHHTLSKELPIEPATRVYQARFSPSGDMLAVCGEGTTVSFWDPARGEKVREWPAHERAVETLAFAPDGQFLATGSSDYSVKLWDARDGTFVREIAEMNYRISSVSFSSDGRYLAIAAINGEFAIVDVASGKPVSRSKHLDGIQAIAFLPAEELLASADRSGSIRVWRWRERAGGLPLENSIPIRGWQAHAGRAYALTPNAGGKSLLSVGEDGTIGEWNYSRPTEHSLDMPLGKQLPPQDFAVLSSPASLDARLLMTSHSDGLRIWNVSTGELEDTWTSEGTSWCDLALSHAGRHLAASDELGRVHLWDVPRRQVVRVFDPQSNTNASWLGWSAKDRYLAVGDNTVADGIHIYDVSTGERVPVLMQRGSARGRFSPQDPLLAIADKNLIEVWDIERNLRLHRLAGHTSTVQGLAFSHHGEWLASSGNDRRVLVWEVATGQLKYTLEAHRGQVSYVAFANDDRTLVSAGEDGRLLFWNMATGSLALGWPAGNTNGPAIFNVAHHPDDWCCLWYRDDRFLVLDLR